MTFLLLPYPRSQGKYIYCIICTYFGSLACAERMQLWLSVVKMPEEIMQVNIYIVFSCAYLGSLAVLKKMQLWLSVSAMPKKIMEVYILYLVVLTLVPWPVQKKCGYGYLLLQCPRK
jgi:hypothetical protein